MKARSAASSNSCNSSPAQSACGAVPFCSRPPPPPHTVLRHEVYATRLDLKEALIDDWVGEFQRHGLVAADGLHWLQLCLEEIVVNAMLHGNEGDPRLQIALCLGLDEHDHWTLAVTDQGQGFQAAALPDPDDPASLLLEHGRGILLVREWVGSLVFHDDGRSAWLRRRSDRPISS